MAAAADVIDCFLMILVRECPELRHDDLRRLEYQLRQDFGARRHYVGKLPAAEPRKAKRAGNAAER